MKVIQISGPGQASYALGSPLLRGLGSLGLDFNTNLVPPDQAAQEAAIYQNQTAYNIAHPEQLPPNENTGTAPGLLSLVGGMVSKVFGAGASGNTTFSIAQQNFARSQSTGALPVVVGVLGFGALLAGVVYLSRRKS